MSMVSPDSVDTGHDRIQSWCSPDIWFRVKEAFPAQEAVWEVAAKLLVSERERCEELVKRYGEGKRDPTDAVRAVRKGGW